MVLQRQIALKYGVKRSTRNPLKIKGKEGNITHLIQIAPLIRRLNPLNLIQILIPIQTLLHPMSAVQVKIGVRRERDIQRETDISEGKRKINAVTESEGDAIRNLSANPKGHWMILLIVKVVEVAPRTTMAMFVRQTANLTRTMFSQQLKISLH
jgi:hypothetical protein